MFAGIWIFVLMDLDGVGVLFCVLECSFQSVFYCFCFVFLIWLWSVLDFFGLFNFLFWTGSMAISFMREFISGKFGSSGFADRKCFATFVTL